MTMSSVETIQGVEVRALTLYKPYGSSYGMYRDLGYDCTYEYEPQDTDETATVQNAFDGSGNLTSTGPE